MENITEIISKTINELFSSLFSSIDNSIYSTLDSFTFINTDIIKNNTFEKILNESTYNSLLVLANSLIIGLVLYYAFKLLFSNLTFCQIERPSQFVFKLIIYTILVNSSYFLCEQFININSIISESIREIGTNLFNVDISFSSLITKLNSTITINSTDFSIFSIDGIIKSFISVRFI